MTLGRLVQRLALSSALALSACSSVYTLPPGNGKVDAGDHRFSRRDRAVYYEGMARGEHRYGGSGVPILEQTYGGVIIDVRGRVIQVREEATGRQAEVEPPIIRSGSRCPFSFLWRNPRY